MSSASTIALLPSPLLGPALWQPVRAALLASGFETIIAGRSADQPGSRPAGRAASTAEVLASYLDALPADRPYVLVPHSNAGLYVPGIAQRRTVTGYVFVDAVLPPRSGTVRVAPERLLEMISPLADDEGILPPWTSWWDEASVAELFDSAQVRERVEAEQSRLPLAYFRETLKIECDWATRSGAYLAFGDSYAEERARAQSWRWPTQTLAGHHLHLLIHPQDVAAAIARAITGWCSPARGDNRGEMTVRSVKPGDRRPPEQS